jgi:hypothetical protein
MAETKIKFVINGIKIRARLRNTPTANKVAHALPLSSTAETWGEEVYFSVPVATELERDAKSVVEAGEIAFWVEGSCMAIGFGPTPISQGEEIRLAAATNIFADACDDVTALKSVPAGAAVTVDWDR